MSFEGRYQVWCEKGHYTEMDCYAFDYLTTDICSCGHKRAIVNLIDDTNGEEQGKIIPELIYVSSCEYGGSPLETVFKIPTKEELNNK